MDFIKVEDLTVAYDLKPVLWDIDVSFPKGKLIAILGPNGAGKSTLIKAMINLVKPVSGVIKFEGRPYEEVYKSIAYVPQKGSVDWDFPTTVYDVVSMGRYGHVGWFKKLGKKDHELTTNALKMVGMEGFSKRQISELSGGQQQRVFLARALVQDADIYFMDEPFQGVDIKTERAIIEILKELKSLGKTVIVVHHDLETVNSYFDWVVLLNLKVIASGAVSDVFNERTIEKTFKNNKLTELKEESYV